MNICDEVRDLLAEAGSAAVAADERLARHLGGCADCQAVERALSRIDAALAGLPSPDAPDAAVAATLKAVTDDRGGRRTGEAEPRRLAGALAAALVLAASFGVGQHLLGRLPEFGVADPTVDSLGGVFAKVERKLGMASAEGNLAPRQVPEASAAIAGGERFAVRSDKDGASTLRPAPAEQPLNVPRSAAAATPSLGREAELVARLQQLAAVPEAKPTAPPVPGAPALADTPGPQREQVGQSTVGLSGRRKVADLGDAPQAKRSARQESPLQLEKRTFEPPARGATDDYRGGGKREPGANEAPAKRDRSFVGAYGGSSADEEIELDLPRRNVAGPALDDARARLRARTFIARYASLDGLAYKDPAGYWANTYIPGDPAMRLLRARLSEWDRTHLGTPALERQAQQAAQPFDRPDDAALALYLDADVASIQGPTRLRVQVGLKGAERLGGHRPAMNVGLVLDARALDRPEVAQRVRALAAALARARQPGDRFSLIVAGPSGGLLVPAESFRHGPLQVALARLGGGSQAVGLTEAVTLAAETARQGVSDDAVLGGSLVLLATASDLSGELEALEAIAHENAVAGVPTSVVNLGGAALEQVDRVVAAGQGNRRMLADAESAEALVDAELHAASRVVARALRLRIRLAPGVQLVDVLGSHRLGAPDAQRVRQAEQAIDRRLAQSLGITADRGQDEEGIQIVIPNFHAGDAHVVLLDVTAARPGPIADVTVRYKDVLRLGNGVAQASLALPAGGRGPGPLERSVQKNLLAFALAEDARRLGLELERAPETELLPTVAAMRELVRGFRLEVPGWAADTDLAADEDLLAGYVQALRAPAAADPVQRQLLGQSLRYTAFAKLHTRRE